MSKSEFTPNYFNLSSMAKNPNILIISENTDERNTMIKDVVKVLNSKSAVLVSKSEKYVPTLSKLSLFSKSTEHTYDPKTIRKHLDNESKDKLFVMNNVSSRLIEDDNQFMELVMNGRHYNTAFIYASQYNPGFDGTINTNFDYVFVGKYVSKTRRRSIFDNFAGMFPSYSSFAKVHNKTMNTSNYLMFNQRFQNGTIYDAVFRYETTKTKEMRLANKMKRKQNKRNLAKKAASMTTKHKPAKSCFSYLFETVKSFMSSCFVW